MQMSGPDFCKLLLGATCMGLAAVAGAQDYSGELGIDADDLDIGAPYLAAFWQDPDFDAGQRAFYYVRVLEIPMPSWLAYDKALFGDAVELPDDAVLVQQERAYTSPIWYTP